MIDNPPIHGGSWCFSDHCCDRTVFLFMQIGHINLTDFLRNGFYNVQPLAAACTQNRYSRQQKKKDSMTIMDLNYPSLGCWGYEPAKAPGWSRIIEAH